MNLELLNQINEAYRTGNTISLRVDGVLDTELVNDIHELYYNGYLHLPKYYQVFGYSKAKNLKEVFKRLDLKILTMKQTHEIYRTDIQTGKKKTNLERYGVENPGQDPAVREKVRKTNLERYGVENPGQDPAVREKVKKTNLERYGSTSPFGSREIREKVRETFIRNFGYNNPFQSPEIQDRVKQTNLERYGSISPLGSREIRERIKQTNLERYGSVSPLGSREIMEKARMTCKANFGFEHPLQDPEIREKVKKTNLERYGSVSPLGSPDIREKIDQTNLERYGVKIPIQNPEIQEKIKSTNLERYGVENPLQSPEIRDKIKRTNLERYGVENPIQNPEIQEKAKQTNLERYGYENPFGSPEIRDRIKRTNLERYGFECASKSPEIQEKAKQTNLERYGYENPFSSPEIRGKIKQTNLEKYGSPSPLGSSMIREKAKSTRKSNDWRYARLEELVESDPDKASGFVYKNYTNQSKVLKRYGLYQENLSTIEIAIREILEKYKIEYLFRHRPKFMDGKELDFFIPNKSLAIEVNGLYWHSSKFKDKYYHQNKHLRCRSEGIQLLSFTEDQILDRLEIIESMILHKLGLTPYRVYAKKCDIVEIDHKKAKDFLENNHLHGFSNASVYLGLEYNGKLVHVMSFGNNRFKKSNHPELIRSASLRFHSVAGGFQRLLKYYKARNNIDLVESYVDFNISNGQSYELASRDLGDLPARDNLTEPDLWFVYKGKRYRRQMFMKHNLHKIFEDFPRRSEDGYKNITCGEFLRDRGVLEYYGAGNLKYLI